MTRILLVEDDEDIRPLIEEILLDAGYHVDTAATVAGAFDLLGRGSYDLLLTDGRLPDGNGLMIAEKLAGTGTKIVLFTGYIHEFPPEELAKYTVLTKPMGLKHLVAAVAKALAA